MSDIRAKVAFALFIVAAVFARPWPVMAQFSVGDTVVTVRDGTSIESGQMTLATVGIGHRSVVEDVQDGYVRVTAERRGPKVGVFTEVCRYRN